MLRLDGSGVTDPNAAASLLNMAPYPGPQGARPGSEARGRARRPRDQPDRRCRPRSSRRDRLAGRARHRGARGTARPARPHPLAPHPPAGLARLAHRDDGEPAPVTTPAALLELAREVAAEAGELLVSRPAGGRRRHLLAARRIVQVEPDRSRHRDRPRQRGPDRRFAASRPARTTASWARKAAPARARPASRGSSTPSTAPSTTSTASRSSPCRSRLRVEGRSVAGVVHNPVTGEMFAAAEGAGASLNGRELRLEATGSAARRGARRHRFLLPGATPRRSGALAPGHPPGRPRHPTRAGSAALDLCAVACGRLDGFYEAGLEPWDLAAGEVIARGGRGHGQGHRGTSRRSCDGRGRRPRAGGRVDRPDRACRLRLRLRRLAGRALADRSCPRAALGTEPARRQAVSVASKPSRPRRR